MEFEGSGEVQIVADLELAGLEQEEGGDQMWVAADDPELAAKLLFPVGHVTRTPSPLPVREAAVETVPNHEDVGCSQHQISLSKGLIAKFVQRKELGTVATARNTKSHRCGGFLCLCLCDWNCVYFKSSKWVGMKWQVFAVFPEMGSDTHAATLRS
jgi:hypothetical protein